MKSNSIDFNIFQGRILLSQRKGVPLHDKLRELMASVLGKALDYSGYLAVLHIFINQERGEAHVMALRRGTAAWLAVEDLAMHREGVLEKFDLSRLPEYLRLEIRQASEFLADLCGRTAPFMIEAPIELLEMLATLTRQASEDLCEFSPTVGDELIVVPLARPSSRHLGALLFHGSPEAVTISIPGDRKAETFIEFGLDVSKLLERVFSGLYRIPAHTYLPSYCLPERKKVALLYSEVRHFDLISRTLDTRSDMNATQRRACLRELVNCFSETVADVVELYKGRIDQLWGGGLLAIFGDYRTQDTMKTSPCMRALQAAAEAVKGFDKAMGRWFDENFKIAEFRADRHEHVATALGIVVSFGEVEFDYLGSRGNRRYMSFGDHVSLVKELARRACRTELDEDSNRLDAPILATQPVFLLARRACIHDRPNTEVGSVDRNALVRLPGRPAVIPIYCLWPDNVDT